MRSITFLLTITGLLSVFCASTTTAQTDREVYLYRGTPAAQSGIVVGGWGSGQAVESSDSTRVLTGSRSIKLTTQGLYAGARIDFVQPITLFSGGIDPSRYIVFSFYFEDVQTIDPAAQNPVYSYDVEPYTIPRVSTVRFVFVSEDWTQVEVEQPTNPLDPEDNWCRVAVPFAKFKTASGELSEFKLKRLLIFSDLPNTFYLGEIKLLTDKSTIKVDALPSQVVVIYDEVILQAKADGGVSSLIYSWDFDSSNGIQEELTGPIGRYVYTRGGDYTVTLTVKDADGIKKPVTVTTTISVNE